MTPDAFSDLVLALTCAVLAHRCRGDGRGGVAVACLLIGIAALLGMLRFSSWEPLATAVGGAHRFASLVAAVAGFPLLAFSLASPGGALARHAGGAWWLAFAVGGFGVAAWLLGFKVWAQLAPLASVAAIAWAVQRHGAGGRRWAGFAGVLLLCAGFAIAAGAWPTGGALPALLSKTQALHYALAGALWLVLGGIRT
jgi:hypothetical protein